MAHPGAATGATTGGVGPNGPYPAPYDTNVPNTPQYLQANNIAKQAYDNSLAKIKQKRGNTLLSAGYTADFNDQGGYSNLRVDSNNVGGGLQTMLRNQGLAHQQAQFLGQERGLHGGLANQAQSELQYASGQQSAEFGRGLVSDLDANISDQQQAAVEYNRTMYEAMLEATRQAIANQQFNPGSGPDPNGPDDDNTDDKPGPDETQEEKDQREAQARFAAWLKGQQAAAGGFRQDDPRGMRGTYVN